MCASLEWRRRHARQMALLSSQRGAYTVGSSGHTSYLRDVGGRCDRKTTCWLAKEFDETRRVSDAPHIHAPVCIGAGKNSDVFLSTPRFQRRSRLMSIPKHMTARQNFSVSPRHPFSAAAAIWLLSSLISGKKLPVVDKTRRDNEYEQSINTSIETCLKRTL